MKKVGMPSEQDRSFITNQDAMEYIETFIDQSDNAKSHNLESIFPNVSSDLLDLLKGLLEFNPHFRLTAKQALQSKVFDDIRVDIFEKGCPI